MGTSYVWATVMILVGILLIGAGGILGTLGWNDAQRVGARIEMIAGLHDAARASQQTLTQSVRSDSLDSSLPVETAQFTAALASGLFVGPEHSALRDGIRRAQAVLTEYNYALSNKYAATVWAHEPKDLPELAGRGAGEVQALADLLETRYGVESAAE